MVKVELFCDTRERAIQDSINAEFTKPPTFAKTRGEMVCSVKQVAVGDYMVSVDDTVVAVFERKTLKDYGASFKDNRHANKVKLLNARNISGCQIYYIIEGPLNPDYESEYAGIKYKNILASMHDLMIKDGIFIIRTQDGQHTARELRMFCESQIRQAVNRLAEAKKVKQTEGLIIEQKIDSYSKVSQEFKDKIASGTLSIDELHAEAAKIDLALAEADAMYNNFKNRVLGGETHDELKDETRAPVSFEELQTKADLTPEEKLCKCRVEAWKSLPGIGNNTAIYLASQFTLSDWISGKIGDAARDYSYNGRRNKKITDMLLAPPTADMQIGILAATNGLTKTTATEIIGQYTLIDLLKDVDYSAVRYGKKGTKLTKARVASIKSFLSGINHA